MIEKILNKFGYIKKENISEKEIMLLFSEIIGDVNDYKIEKESETNLFEELSVVQDFKEYLQATSAKDIQRYFAAHGDTDTQNLIRGAMSRTSYFLAMLKKDKIKKDTKLKNLRYE
jgi:hypothetical protein